MQQTHRRGDTCVARNTAARNTAAPNPHARPTSSRNPPQPPTHNATGQLCRSGTGRHEWRPYELRRKTTDAKQRSAAAMQQTHRRGDTCVARNTAARNTGAPQSTRTPPSTRNPTARFPLPKPERVSRTAPTATEKTTPLPVKTGTAPARTGRASTRKCGAIEKLFAY